MSATAPPTVARRVRRLAVLVALAGVLAVAAGCATKSDVRDLRGEIAALRAQQDSLFTLLLHQNRAILDTVSANTRRLLRLRGRLGQQLLEMEQQLVQIQELTGQSQRRLAGLREQLRERSSRLEALTDAARSPAAADAPAVEPDSAPAAGEVVGASAEELYAIGVEQLQRGAVGTARRAFDRLLSDYPRSEIAPAAQFYLAETYAREGRHEQALREFERVVELYPNAGRAPAALYRAGVIAQEQGNISLAREYFERVLAGYPESDEAGAATQKLERLRG